MSGLRWHILQWTLFLFVLAALAAIIMHYSSELAVLSWNCRYFAPFLLVSLLCLLLRALLVGEYAAYFDAKLRFREMIGLTIVSTTLSESLPASAGTLIKATYLWRVHRLAVSASVVMVITNSIVITAASSALAIVGLVLVGWGPSALTCLFAAVLALCTLPFLVFPRSLATRLAPLFQKTVDAWREIHDNPRRSCRVLALSIMLCTLDALRFWLAFLLIGIDFSFGAALVVSGVSLLMGYFAIVPGALGFIEASVAGVSVLLGYSALPAVAATLVFRTGILLFTVPTTPIFYFQLMRATRQQPLP